MPKKKVHDQGNESKFVPETKEVEPGVFQTSTGHVPEFEKSIEPLVSPEVGREDLNQAFGSLVNKINEIIKKVN